MPKSYVPNEHVYVSKANTYVSKANTYVPKANTYVPKANTYIPKANTYVPKANTCQANTYISDKHVRLNHMGNNSCRDIDITDASYSLRDIDIL